MHCPSGDGKTPAVRGDKMRNACNKKRRRAMLGGVGM